MRLILALSLVACAGGGRRNHADTRERPYTQLLEPGATWGFVLAIETPAGTTNATLGCLVGDRRVEGDVTLAPLACRASVPLDEAELGLPNEVFLETPAGLFSTRRGRATAIIAKPADIAPLVTSDRLLVAVKPVAGASREHRAAHATVPAVDIAYTLTAFRTGWCLADTTTSAGLGESAGPEVVERTLCFDRSQGLLGGHATHRIGTQLVYRLRFGVAPEPTPLPPQIPPSVPPDPAPDASEETVPDAPP